MKISRYFSAFFLTLILLVFSQTIIAQSWDNFNPLHVQELNLSHEQNTQLQELEKDHSAKIQAVYKTPIEGKENSKAHYKNIQEQIKLLKAEKENAQKVILTADQLAQFEGYMMEKKADQKGNDLTYQKERFESDYLGVFLTNEQNVAIYDKKKLLDQEKVEWKQRKEKTKEIYQEVLTEEQYAIVVKIDKEKKEAREEKALMELKKVLFVAEELMPLVEDFTIPKLKVLRNKLDAKISTEDKNELEDLRVLRGISFDEVFNEAMDEMEIEIAEVENPELKRYIDFSKSLIIDNKELISNAWAFSFFNTDDNSKRLNKLVAKYQNEIDALDNELLFVIKESIKKGAVAVSAEYPVPPVALWIDEVKLDDEMKRLFLLLDPTDDFAFDIQNFEPGEGQHVASTFPNPASKNQTLEFHTQQDGKVIVEIIDESGKVVKVISNENRMKGNQKLEVNLQDLNSQIYFYRISSDEGMTLIKFSVVK
ncbi:MAG: T9SS type A sorting domain-containing protein [Saprospiraceae bacterium]